MPADSVSRSSIKLCLFHARLDRRDRSLRKELEQKLHFLERDDQVSIWHPDRIDPGESVIGETIKQLQEADIILLLINQALLDPEYYNSQEMEVIRHRPEAEEVDIIPILLSPTVGWEGKNTWFGERRALPFDGITRPISDWSNRGQAFANIVERISERIASIQDARRELYQWLIEEPGEIHSDIIRRETIVHTLYSLLSRDDVNALVISGIPDSGKSTLAHLIYEHAEDQRQSGNGPFKLKALWLTIDAATTLNDIAGTLIEALQGPSPYFPTIRRPIKPHELPIPLFNVLNDAEPRLIVLDQFEHLLDVRDGTYLPGVAEWLGLLSSRGCRCRLLITTNVWSAHPHIDSSAYLRIYSTRGLETAEGIALLQSRHVVGSPQALETIVQRWQGHPKALTSLAKLLARRQKSLGDFLANYQSTTDEVGPFSFLDNVFRQLDETQRRLLFAFAIFRKPVSLAVAQTLIDEHQRGLTSQFRLALDELLALQLLEAEQDRYQPHTLIAEYTLTHMSKGDENALRETVCHAHLNAAQYYEQQFVHNSPPQRTQRRISDVHDLIEVVWHLCQAEQWSQAYELIMREHLFADLQRWGSSKTLLELYELLFPLERWQPEPSRAAQIHAELGSIYHHIGQKEKARNELEQALRLFEALDKPVEMIFTLNTLGEVYREVRMPARAITCYERALTLCERIQSDEIMQLKGIALNNLGSAYHELKQWEQARRYYEEALTYHLDVSEAAITRNNLGQLYEILKRPEDAFRLFKQALGSFQAMGDRRGEAATLINLGNYWRKRGEPEQAFTCYRQSVHLFQEIGDHWGEVRVLRNLAHWYRLSKNYRYALAFLYRAGDMLEELHSPRKQEVEELIALLRHELGQDAFELLATEVRPQAAQIVEEALRRDKQQ